MLDQQLITKDHLEAAGVNTANQDIDALLTHLNDTLEERVGAEITSLLTDNKLTDLIALQEQGDDETVGKWIYDNVPELQQIAEDERAILLGELAKNADAL